MKKIYERPTVEVVFTGVEGALLAGSPVQIGGGEGGGETTPIVVGPPTDNAPGFFFTDDLDEDDEY